MTSCTYTFCVIEHATAAKCQAKANATQAVAGCEPMQQVALESCQRWQVSYAIAAAFNEAAAGGGKGAKRPRAEEGEEPVAAAKPGKGNARLLEKKSPVTLAKVCYQYSIQRLSAFSTAKVDGKDPSIKSMDQYLDSA